MKHGELWVTIFYALSTALGILLGFGILRGLHPLSLWGLGLGASGFAVAARSLFESLPADPR